MHGHSHSHLRRPYKLPCTSSLSYVPCFSSHVCIQYLSHIEVHQAAKGVTTNYDELAGLFESIDHLLKPLDIYAHIPPTPAMDETVVKIMVELLSTLALTTKELKPGRQSEFVYADMLY
jgi:hypothetical protein